MATSDPQASSHFNHHLRLVYQVASNQLDWTPQLETNMLGFVQANGHIVPHFGNMDTFIVDKATHKSAHGTIESNGVPASYDIPSMAPLLQATMDAVAAAAQNPDGLNIVKFMVSHSVCTRPARPSVSRVRPCVLFASLSLAHLLPPLRPRLHDTRTTRLISPVA